MMNNKKKPYFVIVWQEEIELFTGSSERLVYESIKSYSSNGKEAVTLSYREIAKRANLSKSIVPSAIRKLIKKGMLATFGEETRIGGSVATYQIISPHQEKERKSPEGGQLDNESVQNKEESVQRLASNIPQSNKESVAGITSKEKVWETFSVPYLKKLNISDPTFIQSARLAFFDKAKRASSTTVHAFIDKQREITPPDNAEFKADLWEVLDE